MLFRSFSNPATKCRYTDVWRQVSVLRHLEVSVGLATFEEKHQNCDELEESVGLATLRAKCRYCDVWRKVLVLRQFGAKRRYCDVTEITVGIATAITSVGIATVVSSVGIATFRRKVLLVFRNNLRV